MSADLRGVKGEEDFLAAERAAEWLVRLPTASAAEREEFVRWMKESPRNLREILFASSVDVALNLADSQHRIDVEALIAKSDHVPAIGDSRTLSDPPAAKTARFPRRWRFAAGLAAGIGLIAAGAFLGWNPNDYETTVGEQRSIELDEGSVILLNARSSVRVDFSKVARDVYLNDGQALFSVARDGVRPFRVHVDESVIQAIGTKFDVLRVADRVDVAVLEGRVQVANDGADSTTLATRAQLVEGQALSISHAGKIGAPVPVDLADISAWRQRRLVFRGRPLSEIVDEFQRYNRTPRIRVEGAALRAQRFDGVFDADDPETLIAYLATDNAIAFDRSGNELVIRLKPPMGNRNASR